MKKSQSSYISLIFLIASLLFQINVGNAQESLELVKLKAIYERSLSEYDSIESEIGNFIETSNVRMHYIQFGKKTGTPIIWIHGTGSSSWEILSFKQEMEKQNFRVIAIDYYGHGQTPMPEEDKSIYHVADDIKELMISLKIEKAIIGGWSRGGYIASAFYDEYPELVLGLMLVDGGSANALTTRYKMDRDTLKAKYREARIPQDLLTTYPTKFEAFCSFADTSDVESQAWIIDGLKKDKTGRWGYTSEVWPKVANESTESMIAAIESPTLAPLMASSTYLIEPLVVYRNLNVPLTIIDPMYEGETWQDYYESNAKLKNAHPKHVIHEVYQDTYHNAHFARPKKFLQDLEALKNRVEIYHGR